MFHNAKTYETGLSGFHKLVVNIMKLRYKKRPPRLIKCSDYKKFSNEHCKIFLNENVANKIKLHNNCFEKIV